MNNTLGLIERPLRPYSPEVFVMNIKKNIKRIAALGMGAAMIGTSIMGAAAADLSQYPRPFVRDGQFDAMLIIGEDARTPDVISAVDIATSLQYEMRQPATIVGNGEGQTVSVSGDALRIDLDHNRLEFGEMLGSVLSSLTKDDLEALRDGRFHGQDYTQTITLGDGVVRFSEGDGYYYDDEAGWYLEFDQGDTVYRYSLEFPASVRSTITNGEARDFRDRTIEMLGREYTVGAATISNGMLTLELLGGEVRDALQEDQSGTYSLNGREYEVEVVYGFDGRARFVVNGEQTDVLDEGDTYQLRTGTEIGVRRVLPQSGDRPSIVEFFLGADKVILQQTNDPSGSRIEVGDERYRSTRVHIDGEVDGNRYELRSIEIEVKTDDKYFLKAGDSISDFIGRERDDILFGDFNVWFFGPTAPGTFNVELRESRDDEYSLRFETRAGVYNIPIWYYDELRLGGDRNDMTFWVVPGYDLDETQNEVWISQDDKFVLNTATARAEDTTTRVFRFERAREDGSERYRIVLRDMASGGATREVVVRYDSNDDIYKGTFRVDGQEHKLLFDGASAGGSMLLGLEEVYHAGILTHTTGTYFEFRDIGAYNIDDEWEWDLAAGYDLVHIVPENRLTGQAASDQEWVISMGDGMSVQTPSYSAGSMVSVDDRYDTWFSTYGVRVREDTDATRERIDMTIPQRQMLPQVYVTSGHVDVSDSEHTVPGDYYELSPVNFGIARLDTDVAGTWRNENVIVVGGPCVNNIAAELLGNPEVCTDGFTEGSGRIKLFEHDGNIAMLVAGYSATDTMKAASVLHNFRDYDLTGREIEVTGTNMADLIVVSVE